MRRKTKKHSKVHRVKKSRWIIGTVFMWLAGVFLAASYWAFGAFGEMDFATILFHLREPLEGTNTGPFADAAPQVAVVSILFTVAGVWLALRCDTNRQIIFQIHKKQLVFSLDFWNRHFVLHSVLVCILAAVVGLVYLGVPEYVMAQIDSSTLYEEYYVEPETASITFPDKKQNLIYIFMESMENTFMSVEHGGLEYAEMIPELYELQLANTNFTADGTVNGAFSPYGTTWTMGGMVAQTAGIPLNIPVGGNAMGDGYQILEGAFSIGEILEQAGYNQEFLVGSNATFGGRRTYMKNHGNYTIRDYNYAKKKGWIAEDYFVWWGYEDRKLYEFAQKEIQKLAKKDEPFNFTMLTVDTHFVGGYTCELCQDEFQGDSYAAVYACASRQVAEFVAWVRQQPFAEDTTIIICGDHLTMDNDYVKSSLGELPAEGVRKVYTTVINPVCEYELTYNRMFTTFDMYPTTLASLGCQIEGNRLGLGTNLFSDTPTLVEVFGVDGLNAELMKNSHYYNDNILYK